MEAAEMTRALDPRPPVPGLPGRDAAQALQAHTAGLAARLRAEAAALLLLRRGIEPSLSPEPIRHAMRQEGMGGLALSLYDLSQGLVAEGLSRVIAELERMAAATDDAPCPPERDFFDVWRELDPEAPREEARG